MTFREGFQQSRSRPRFTRQPYRSECPAVLKLLGCLRVLLFESYAAFLMLLCLIFFLKTAMEKPVS